MSERVSSAGFKDLAELLREHTRRSSAALDRLVPRNRSYSPTAQTQALENALRRAVDAGVVDSPGVLVEHLKKGGDPSPLLELLVRNTAEQRAKELTEDEEQGRPHVFEFDNYETKIVLTETPPEGWIATIRDHDKRPIRIRLEPHNGDVAGSFRRDNGGIVTLVVDSRSNTLTFKHANGTDTLYSVPYDEKPFAACVRAQREHIRTARIARTAASSTPEVVAALALVQRMHPATGSSTFKVFDMIDAYPEAASRGAAAIPLLYALVASGNGAPSEFRAADLRNNLGCVLDDPLLPPLAHKLLQRVVREYDGMKQSPNALRFRMLTIGAHAAIAAITDLESARAGKGPVELELLLKGARKAFTRLIEDRDGDLYFELASCWARVFNMLVETLPIDHPAAQRLRKAHSEVEGLKPLHQASHYVLALGEACHFIDHGAFPELSADQPGRTAMPLPAVRSLDRPLHLRELRGPLGEKDVTWRDIEQGIIGNCYFGGGVGAVALARPDDIAKLVTSFTVRPDDAEQGGDYRNVRVRYHVPLPNRKPFQDEKPERVIEDNWVDGRVYAERDGSAVYGHSRGSDALEAKRALYAHLEKAFAHTRQRNARYDATEEGRVEETFGLIYGDATVATVSTSQSDEEKIALDLATALTRSQPIACATYCEDAPYAESQLRAAHYYMISGIERSSEGTRVSLINLNRERPPRPDTIDAHVLEAVFNPEDLRIKAFGEFDISIEEFRRDISDYTFVALPARVNDASRARVRGFSQPDTTTRAA